MVLSCTGLARCKIQPHHTLTAPPPGPAHFYQGFLLVSNFATDLRHGGVGWEEGAGGYILPVKATSYLPSFPLATPSCFSLPFLLEILFLVTCREVLLPSLSSWYQ